MTRLRLVIFDCDGVLIDSEAESRALISEAAHELGWALSLDQAHRFTGLSWSSLQPVFEREAGRPVPPGWGAALQVRLIERLKRGVSPISGACEVLRATAALGLPYRVASNSSHVEMAIKFARSGFAALVEGRLHSAQDVGVPKPAPDLFLAAARAEGVAPELCLVVEDSAPGIAAAHAAGMRCVVYAPEGEPPAPADFTIRSLAELPPLCRRLSLERAA